MEQQQTLQETLQSLGKEKPINKTVCKRGIAGAYNNLQMASDEVLDFEQLNAESEIAIGK
jgi:hypothetical protein